MTRKILPIIIALICFNLTCSNAREIVTTDKSQLPNAAQSFLNTHFSNEGIYLVEIEKDLVKITSYEVILRNGCNVEFNSKGQWKEIDCLRNKIPSSAIPQQIVNYVNKKYNGEDIVSIEKKWNKYEVELGNRTELIFDSNYNFIKQDD